MKNLPKPRGFVSLILIICLLTVIIIGGSLYIYNLKNTKVSTPFPAMEWNNYKSQDSTFSFKFPKRLSTTVDNSIPTLTRISLSLNSHYNFSEATCSADYLLTGSKAFVSFDDIGSLLSKEYFNKPQIDQKTISGRKAYVLSGISEAKTISAIYAPPGSPVYIAFLDNGDNILTFASCGKSAHKSEFDQIISTFTLTGLRTSDAPTPLAVQRAQSVLRSRDSQRGADLNNLSIAARFYKQANGNYPIHSTCTSLTQLQTELSTLPGLPTSLQLSFLDPRAISSSSAFLSSWPNYCYQSDSTGSMFILWAKTESDSNKGIKEISGTTIPTAKYFEVPAAYTPNALYVQVK